MVRVYVYLNNLTIAEDKQQRVRCCIVDYLQANGTDFVESELDLKKDCFGRSIVLGGQAHVSISHSGQYWLCAVRLKKMFSAFDCLRRGIRVLVRE
ncbi:hypothetical protein D3C73_1147500 [compost metagenome]